MKKIIIAIICSIIATYTQAGSLSSYRALKSNTVIKCSPNGKDGGELPINALQALKKGMTLIILPGEYESPIMISEDRIIITSDGSANLCDLKLQITGKKCLIKDINIASVNSREDLAIIDSFINYFRGRSNAKSKPNYELYNSCFKQISSSWYPAKFKLIDCSIINNTTALKCSTNSSWDIKNSIIYSSSTPLIFTDSGKKKTKMVLRDSLLFGKTSLAIKGESEQALDAKKLKRIAKVSLLGDTIFKMPIFEKEVKLKQGRDGRGFEIEYFNATPAVFRLKPDSPGFGKGVVYEQNIFFKKREKVVKEKSKKTFPKDWNKRWKDLAEKAKNKQKKKKKPQDEEDDEFGGIPLEP